MIEKLFNKVHNLCINNKYSISVSRFQKNANISLQKKVLENLTKLDIRSIIVREHLISYLYAMFDAKKSVIEFTRLSHIKKLKKVKEILEILSKKSPFFADLYSHFDGQKDIQENALDAMYGMVMNLLYQQNK